MKTSIYLNQQRRSRLAALTSDPAQSPRTLLAVIDAGLDALEGQRITVAPTDHAGNLISHLIGSTENESAATNPATTPRTEPAANTSAAPVCAQACR